VIEWSQDLVVFQYDGIEIGRTSSPPSTTPWNTALLPEGTHKVSATARDFAGRHTTETNTVTVHNGVDGQAPTVGTTVPQANGTTFPVGATMNAKFSEAVTGVDAGSFTLKNTVTGALFPRPWRLPPPTP
jgi:hypothetical protein